MAVMPVMDLAPTRPKGTDVFNHNSVSNRRSSGPKGTNTGKGKGKG